MIDWDYMQELLSEDPQSDNQQSFEYYQKWMKIGTDNINFVIDYIGAASLVLQSKPLLTHERFTKPVLIVQPEKDEMTPKYYTEKVFKQLGSEIKRYVLIKNAAHFPTHKSYYQQWAKAVDEFIGGLCPDP